ncbi:hypothetical protein F1_00068 [Ralstonia phage Heva]|uniref:Peptidase S74 domain-containing protein n=1 Tax=Ralstonia phage Heva TaxID=2759730 RepID=A0A7G5BAV8_9CAUD|nr:tail fiber protein [Ralstonia phage Heva]QMV33431.1 hypothetical protein F1_00068 [Ralstonia phage Heva]
MADVQFANNAVSRLVGPLTPSGTSLTVTPGDGALFPTLGAGDWFMATLIRADGAREIVKVTSRTVDAMSITRAQESTSALSFSPNDRIEARLTKSVLDAFRDGISSAQAAASAAQSAADGKVSKAGDTMSGNLTLPGIAVENSAPIVTFRETDQGAPAGRWRLVSDGGNWFLRRSTAGEFSSENNTMWFGADDNANFQNDILIGRGGLGSVYDALASKATTVALNNGLAGKLAGDGSSVVGFVNGNYFAPYIRKTSDNTVRQLVANTSGNAIALSWSGTFLSRTIDNSNTATMWDTANAPNIDKSFYSGDGTRIGRSWGVGSGFITLTVDGGSYGITINPSDERLKREIAPSATDALDKLGKIELFSFRYREGNPFLNAEQQHEIGFIAQQLERIDPTFAAGGGETMLSPNLLPIVATLVKAVQELRAQVDALKAQVVA